MEEGKSAGEMSKEDVDVFIKIVENGGAMEGGFSTSDFSIEQLVTLEGLEKDELLTVELRTTLVPACFITVKVAEGVKSM